MKMIYQNISIFQIHNTAHNTANCFSRFILYLKDSYIWTYKGKTGSFLNFRFTQQPQNR